MAIHARWAARRPQVRLQYGASGVPRSPSLCEAVLQFMRQSLGRTYTLPRSPRLTPGESVHRTIDREKKNLEKQETHPRPDFMRVIRLTKALSCSRGASE